MVAVAALLTAGACSRFPFVYLINNSGATIQIIGAEGDGDRYTSERLGDWFFGLVWINHRSARDVMWRWPDIGGELEVKLERCNYRYALPRMSTSYGDAAVLQMEADRQLYLIAESVWNARDSYGGPVSAIPDQPDGFPVRGVTSNDCA